jgi:GTPase SAR1 family protein
MVNGCSSNELISVVAYSEMKFKLKNDKFANLQIWDTAGQDDFQCLAPMYLRKSNCVFIVFDVTSEESFKSIHRWLEVLKDNAGQDLSQIVISILANNIDSLSDRVVFSDEGMAQVNSWSKEYEIHIGYYEVSSNTSMGISETLSEVVHKAVEKYDNRPRVEQVPLVEPVRLKDTADTAKKAGYC